LCITLIYLLQLSLLYRNADSQEAVGSSLVGLAKAYAESAKLKQEESRNSIVMSQHNANVMVRKERNQHKLAEAELKLKERAQALEMIKSDMPEVRKLGAKWLGDLLEASAADTDTGPHDDMGMIDLADDEE
jgi:hypothetical protein